MVPIHNKGYTIDLIIPKGLSILYSGFLFHPCPRLDLVDNFSSKITNGIDTIASTNVKIV